MRSTDVSIGQAASNPFYIGNATVLQELATLVNAGTSYGASGEYSYASAYYVLTDDIDLSGIEWVPIGKSSSYSFQGNFDGSDYTISNMTMTEDNNPNYYGLFGYTKGATISNLTVTGDITLTRTDSTAAIYAAGIVAGASLSAGTISNCTSYVDITCTNSATTYMGGILANAGNAITIENCYSAGNLSAEFTGSNSYSSYVGGIIGNAQSNTSSTVKNCFSTGSIHAETYNSYSTSYAGGIVGNLGANITLKNCVALNESISAKAYSTAKVCVGYIYGSYSGSNLSNCYAWSGTSILANSATTTAADAENTNVTMLTYESSALSGDGITTWDTAFDSGIWETSMSALPNGEDLPSYITTTSVEPDVDDDTSADETDSGKFSLDDGAYTITTAEELAYFATQVNDGESTFRSAYITLGKDIDLGGDADNLWTAIGMMGDDWTEYPFTGTFDGNNHTISGLCINASSSSYQGLFGLIDGATIKNLNVEGSVSSTNDDVAGVVGYASNSTIENCSFSGAVSGKNYVGGVVGCAKKSTIKNCSSSGTVSGVSYVGGVVGWNYADTAAATATVSNCTNYATVSGTGNYIGGVVGYNGASDKTCTATVTNCTNYGTVSGADNVGGVLGINNANGGSASVQATVENCYNTGTVTGTVTGTGDNVGGVVGSNNGYGTGDYTGTATVKNCYNTGAVSGSTYVGGVVGHNNNYDSTVNGTATVSYVYNTGTVTGTGDYVGGVVGYNILYNSGVVSVSNAVSLANSVSGTNYVGRVIGYNNGTAETGLYAWSGTTISNVTSETAVNGADLYYNSSTGFSIADGTFSWSTICGDGWTTNVENYQLPYLTDVSTEIPQNPLANLTFITITFEDDDSSTTNTTVSMEIGGTLTASDIPDAPEGKIWVVDLDTVYYADATITAVDAVAKIGTTQYATLDAALDAASSDADSPSTITLLADIETTATVTIDKTVTIDLDGFDIDAGATSSNPYSVITIVENGNLTLKDSSNDADGRITGGKGTSVSDNLLGGGVFLYNSGDGSNAPVFTLESGNIYGNSAAQGGGVFGYSNTTFTMNGGTISGNTATTSGGGVTTNGAFNMTDGTISDNNQYVFGADGGGVYIGTKGTFNMEGGTISGNVTRTIWSNGAYVGGQGGGVYAAGVFNMSGGAEISGNEAYASGEGNGQGGGVYTGTSATFTMTGGTISGNWAGNYGAGVYATGDTSNGDGYGFYMKGGTISGNISADGGGGVYLKGDMTMTAGSIESNEAAGEGGGVYINDSAASFTMSGGTIGGSGKANTAGDGGGGVYIDKGGEFTMEDDAVISYNVADNTESGNNGTLEDGDSTVANDGNGGGVYISQGTFNMSGGYIQNNSAQSGTDEDETDDNNGNGGGVYVNYDGATFTMTDGEISNNTAEYKGGGVYVYGTFTMSGTALISKNEAVNGGGVYANDGTFTMNGGTISSNEATEGYTSDTVVTEAGGGVYGNTDSTIVLTAGTISGNTATTGAGVYVVGTLELEGDPTVQAVHLTSGTVITLTDEYTGTAIPVTTSVPPVDGTPVTITSGASGNATASDFTSDTYDVMVNSSGEVVLGYAVATVTVNSTTTNYTSLESAVAYANTNGGTVKLLANAETTATLTISNTMTLDLNGYDIQYTGDGYASVITVSEDGNLTLQDSDGAKTGARYVTGTGSSAEISSTSSDDATEITGGAIYGGTGTNTSGSATYGGGVYVNASGSLTMTSGNIVGNSATSGDGGGVYCTGDFAMSGTANISNNEATANGGGGGVYLGGTTATMSGNATISGNTAGSGGGVYLSSGTFAMSDNATISNNTATGEGGGVRAAGGTFTMEGGSITDNTAGDKGGAIYISGGGTTHIKGGTITGNTATTGNGIFTWENFQLSGAPTIDAVYLADDSALRIVLIGKFTGSTIPVTTAVAPTAAAPVTVVVADSGYNSGKLTDTDFAKFSYTGTGDMVLLADKIQLVVWTYTADGATMYAHSDSDTKTKDGGYVTLSASGGDYTGSAYTATATESSWLAGTYTVDYYNGNTKLNSAPSAAGTYTAKITFGTVSASVTYKIDYASAEGNVSTYVTVKDWYTGSGTETLTAVSPYTITTDPTDFSKGVTIPSAETSSESLSITIYVKDSNDNIYQLTVPYKVDTVTPSLSVTEPSASGTSLEYTLSNSSTQISGTTYTVSPTTGASITDGILTITAAGTYTVTATSGAGLTDTETITVHKVTFDGDTTYQLVTDGGKVTEPSDPTKDGYTFSKWMNGTDEFSFDTEIEASYTLTSAWTLNGATIIQEAFTKTYNGVAQTISPIISHDVTVSYSYQWYKMGTSEYEVIESATSATYNVTNVSESGDYKLVVKATVGDYTSTSEKEITVTVNPLTITDSMIAMPTATYTYSGSEHKPLPTISFTNGNNGTTMLTKDTDYTLSYSNNTNAGTATVTVTAVSGNYADNSDGNASSSFTIDPKSVTGAEVGSFTAMTYTGDAQTPSASVTIDGLTATGTWSTVTKVTDTTTFTASGNFTGTLTDVEDGMAKADYVMTGVSFSGDSKTYSGATQNLAITGTLPTGADNIQVTVGYSDGSKDVVTDKEITATFATTSTNYNTPTALTATLTITAKELTITGASATDFTYNGETAVAVSGGELSGLVTNDDVTRSDSTATGTVTDKTVGTDKAVTVSGYTISGADIGNYYLTQPTDVVVTITEKSVTAVWTGTTTVYTGSTQAPSVSLIGAVDTDTVTITTDTATIAGSHTITAELSGTDAGNYTLSNPTTSFTIAKAPVTFTVTDNVVEHDGTEKTATVTPSPVLTGNDYTITYKNSSDEAVASPTDAGTYSIYAEISNTNYRHASTTSGAALQIGTLTIYTVAPTVYTVTFDDGTGELSGISGTIYTLPAGISSGSNVFTGWSYNNVTYKAGDLFTQPSSNVTMTAVTEEVHDITISVYDSTGAVQANTVVTLMSGSNQIDTGVATNGTYTFSGVGLGTYNVVATYGDVTRTAMVEISNQNEIIEITLPEGTTNSIVEVTAGTPDVVVGGLDEIFEGTDETVYTTADTAVVTAGGSVELALTVEEVTATVTPETASAIEAEATNVGIYLDIEITKTVTTVNGDGVTTNTDTSTISQVPEVLTFIIPIPAEYQNKASYTIYREHEGEIQEISTTSNADGEYIVVNEDKTEITLYAKYFSTYALAYTEYSSGGNSYYSSSVASTDNGTVSLSSSRSTMNSTVTIKTTPDDGYEVASVTVTYGSGRTVSVTDNGDGIYSYKQPGASATVTVTFVEIGSESENEDSFFVDVDEDDWFYDAVKWATENGVTSGDTASTFSPYDITTRGQTVTFLWRSMDMPEALGDNPFLDVADDMYYSEAVLWAVDEDITKGTSDTTFSPDMDCSRAHIITFLWRMMGEPVVESDNSFTDVEEGAYYYDAVLWAVANGITTGTSDTEFSPNKDCTRAEIVVFLYRALGD